MVQFMKAVAEVETAAAGIREQAMRVAPHETTSIDDRLLAAREDADKGFFPRATLECRNLLVKVRELAASLPGREAELEARWTCLAEAVAPALASLHRTFARLKRGPAGMSSRWFDSVRMKYLEVQAGWGRAQTAARGTRWAEAVLRGEEARQRATDLAEELRGF